MPRYSIEWSGTITRDIGWIEVEAENAEAAKSQYLSAHPFRRVRSVIEVGAGNSSTHSERKPKQ